MSEEERRRRREQDVKGAVQKLEFMESEGVDPEVTPEGKFGAFLPGRHGPPAGGINWPQVGACLEDLHEMHKSDRERGIILEAWERFRDEEY
jgi:hypothetical protein